MADYRLSGTVTLGIWAKKAGVWVKIMQRNIPQFEIYSTGGLKTRTWYMNTALDLGTGVEAVGITLDSHTGQAATLDDFTELSWQSTASSGVRSATPNGELSTATVRPE